MAEDLFGSFGGEELAVLLGGEKAGEDGVYADAAGGPFAGEELRDLVDAALGDAVGEDTGERRT